MAIRKWLLAILNWLVHRNLSKMISADLHRKETPLRGVEAAVDEVSRSAEELTRGLLAGVKSRSKANGADFRAQAAAMRVRLDGLYKQALAAEKEHPDQVARLILAIVPRWIKPLDELSEVFDKATSLYLMSPREIRRSHAQWFKTLNAGMEDTERTKAMMIDLLEHFDPTPADYLEQEMLRIHGVRAESMIASFKELASSDRPAGFRRSRAHPRR